MLTKENVKEGSNVYKAVQISEPMDISGDHSPLKATTNNQVATEIIDVSVFLSKFLNYFW